MAQQQPQAVARDREFAQIMLSNVHDALKKNYYDPSFHGVDVDQRFKKYSVEIKNASTIQATFRLVEAYLVGLNDSHTVFIPPPNSKRITYGFRFEMIGDKCFITALRPDSDAAQKLKLGDQILSLDGYAVNRADLWQLEYYLNLLPPRQTTDFTLRDPSGRTRKESVIAVLQELPSRHPYSPSLSRMHVESWQHKIRSRSVEKGDVFIWKFASFSEEEASISHMLGEARKHKALILDLRENPGGFRDNLVFLMGGLFDHDVTIANETTRKRQKPLVAKTHGHSAFTGQLTILIDSRSASASEILARVVQIEHRGVVIGDRSAGSVMLGQFFPLSAESGLGISYGAEITVADMIMSDGKSLEHVGVSPDVLMIPTEEDLAECRDPVLARAADLSGIKLDSISAGKLFPVEWPSPEPSE
jgi:carboxyl-terminal processing protease